MASKLKDIFAHQLWLPTKGLYGWITFNVLRRRNAALEKAAAQLSAIQPHYNVLELGFGPGVGIFHALQYVKEGPGKVYGLDLSPYMVEKASARLKEPILQGKVELKQGDVMDLPYEPNSFHRVFHCNCYYFWPSKEVALQEISRVMKPGGVMVTCINFQIIKKFTEKGLMKCANTDHVSYMSALEMAGFKDIRMEQIPDCPASFHAIFAHLPDKPDTSV